MPTKTSKTHGSSTGITRGDIERGETAPRVHHVADVEKETIILFNEGEPTAEVFTYNKAWIKHFTSRLKIEPVKDNGYGGLTFKISKKRIPLPRVPRVLSETARKAMGDRLRKLRPAKPTE